MIHHRFHQPFCNGNIVSRLLRWQVFCHFQHAAGCNRCRRRVSGLILISIAKFQIPVRNQILWKMTEKIFCYSFKNRNIGLSFCIFISYRCSVNTPGLSSCPGRTVAVPLTGCTVIRRPCFAVKEKGVLGRKIRTDHVSQRRMNMLFRYLTVFFLSCFLCCPVKKRQV